MNTTKTAAEKFCNIANWLKKQDSEFVANFITMRSIIRLWKNVPEDCRDRKIQPWLKKNGKTQAGQHLMLAVNSEFNFRYFDEAMKRYKVTVRYHEWSFGGRKHMEVILSTYDRYEANRYGDVSITINDRANSRAAAQRLLQNNTEKIKHDMELVYDDKIDLYSGDSTIKEEFRELHSIPGL